MDYPVAAALRASSPRVRLCSCNSGGRTCGASTLPHHRRTSGTPSERASRSTSASSCSRRASIAFTRPTVTPRSHRGGGGGGGSGIVSGGDGSVAGPLHAGCVGTGHALVGHTFVGHTCDLSQTGASAKTHPWSIPMHHATLGGHLVRRVLRPSEGNPPRVHTVFTLRSHCGGSVLHMQSESIFCVGAGAAFLGVDAQARQGSDCCRRRRQCEVRRRSQRCGGGTGSTRLTALSDRPLQPTSHQATLPRFHTCAGVVLLALQLLLAHACVRHSIRSKMRQNRPASKRTRV
eukprot:364733-Chlamydomonas_euryale.AAC.3